MNHQNHISLVGNVAKEPACKEVGTWKFWSVRVACTTKQKGKDGDRDEVLYITVKCPGETSKTCSQLKLGDLVAVEGRVKFEKWTDKATGQEKSMHVIEASKLEVFRKPKKELLENLLNEPNFDDVPF